MKLLTMTAAVVALGGALLTMVPAQAQEYPWCAQYSGRDGGGRNCGFATYRQCMASVSGVGGFCERNLFFRGGRYGEPYAQGRSRRWR